MNTFKTIKKVTIMAALLPMVFISCKDSSTGPEPDPTVPTMVSTSPADDDTDVARNGVIAITFSEEMNPATLNTNSFRVLRGTESIPGSVSYSGMTATFTADNELNAQAEYTSTVSTGARSAAGVALAANAVWNFTTGGIIEPAPTTPTVVSTNPADDDAGVARNGIVEVIFSEAMDPETLTASTFTVLRGTESVDGTVEYAGMTATFTAENTFGVQSEYTATVTTGATSAAGVALAANSAWTFLTGGSVNPLEAVDLGTAGDYVVLAKTAVTNNPTSDFTGDLGLSPAAETYYTGFSQTAATGYSTSAQVTGQMFAADMTDPTPSNLTTAVSDMTTAYNDAAGRPTPDFVELATGNVSGRTLTPGLYKWGNTVTMSSDVTISGGEDEIWIFQIGENLTMGSDVSITLEGGARPENIFWQVAGEVTIGTNAHFEGIILSMTGITLSTGATLKGRILAQTAAIFDANTVVQPQ